MSLAESGLTGVGRCGLARCALISSDEPDYTMTAIRAVSHILTEDLQDEYDLACGLPLSVCGIAALGAPVTIFTEDAVPARCGVARCGASYTNRTLTAGVYAGMSPPVLPRPVTFALTERPGGPADPRQSWNQYSDWNAYDNPAMTLRIIGDDLVWMDGLARAIREAHDMTSHLETPYGTVNGLRIGPAKRINRTTRPRYELDLDIEAEYIRPTQEA